MKSVLRPQELGVEESVLSLAQLISIRAQIAAEAAASMLCPEPVWPPALHTLLICYRLCLGTQEPQALTVSLRSVSQLPALPCEAGCCWLLSPGPGDFPSLL